MVFHFYSFINSTGNAILSEVLNCLINSVCLRKICLMAKSFIAVYGDKLFNNLNSSCIVAKLFNRIYPIKSSLI